MESHNYQHSEEAKNIKSFIINTINSDLKTLNKSKSSEKNNFIPTKDNIYKVFDFDFKNCLKKMNITNKISRTPSVKSSNINIFFNHEINGKVQKDNQNNIREGEVAIKFNIYDKKFIPNKISPIINKENEEKKNNINNSAFNDNDSKVVKNIPSNNNLYLYSLENALSLQTIIIKKLNNKNYIRNGLISDLNVLIEVCPIIKDFEVQQPLFLENDFDIFDKIKIEKFLFILNLSNLISVLNLIWEISDNNSKNFNRYLSNLGIYISYVKRDEKNNDIDFVLLTPLSINLYNYISSYGKTGFQNWKYNDLASEYSDYLEKYGFDDGYCFEELNKINLIQNIEENNYTINPRVMYYFKPNAIKKIINQRIINEPKNYTFPKEENNKFEGYNEIDFCLTMHEDSKISENVNFQLILEENTMKQSDNIILQKDTLYFFEIKKSIEQVHNTMLDTNKKTQRFLEAYKNIELIQNIKFDFENYTSVYICNKDYNQVKNYISKKNIVNNNIIYSNPQIGIGVLIKLRNTMKYLNCKIDEKNEQMIKQLDNQKKEFDNQKKEFDSQKKEFEKRLKLLEDEKIKKEKEIKAMNDKLEIIEIERTQEKYDNLKLTLDVIWPTNIEYIIKNIKGKGFNQEKIKSYNTLYEVFFKLSKEFLKIKKNSLYSRIAPFIGEKIVNDEDIKEWLNIKDILLNRFKETKPYSEYYKAIAEFLYGISYINCEKNLDLDIMSISRTRERKSIKEIILFLEIFYKEKDLNNIELKYQEVVLYLSKDLLDENIINQIICKEKDSKQIISRIISCANQENYNLYNEDY